jgi:flagellar FliJ protein
MNPLSAVQTLLKQAKEARDQAALGLAEALIFCDSSRQKLVMLEQYRSDYLTRQHQALKKLVGTQPLTQYGAFIEKLEEAIQQQNGDVGFREKALLLAREKLIACEKRIQSLELYVDKQVRRLNQIENKKEQKLMDEYAAGVARRIMQNSQGLI